MLAINTLKQMSVWVSLCCSLVKWTRLMDWLIILVRWPVIVLADDLSFTAGWLQLKHSFTVKAYWPRSETESWLMSYLTRGPGTVFFFFCCQYSRWVLEFIRALVLSTGIFSLFSALFLWTQCIYVCMEAQFCHGVKNNRHNHQNSHNLRNKVTMRS